MARPSRLGPKTKDIIRKRLKKGDLLIDLAKEYNVSNSTIHRLKYPPLTISDVDSKNSVITVTDESMPRQKTPKPAEISSGSKTPAEMDNEQFRRKGWKLFEEFVTKETPYDKSSQVDELGRKCIMLEQENILLKMKIAELVMKEG